MGEKTTKIHEFDPVIYPCRIWVGVKLSDKDLADKFYGLDENNELIDISNDTLGYDPMIVACCHPVSDKESGWRGVVLNIHRPKALSVGHIAHEAGHIVDWMCEQFGIKSTSFDDGEPRAYLIQWVANCIDEVKNNKIK